MENPNREQLVSLKVMRLLRPTLYSALPCFTEQEHSTENFSKHLVEQAFSIHQHDKLNTSSNFALTDFLVIPQIFGNLYIGETFTSYICLHNSSTFKVSQLSIKVELQTSTQKLTLPFKSKKDFMDDFNPDEKFDGIVEHDVKELGNHVLICFVSYLTDKNEKMSFKKFYKFMVSKPFEIQPRFPFIESQNKLMKNSLIFQAQIQNTTNNTLFMESVKLQPPHDGVIIDDMIAQLENESIQFMKPSEIKQYLFKVTFENIDKEQKPLVVGKLDISWRNSFGEYGHLQTNPLNQTQEIFSLTQNDIKIKAVGSNLDECVVDEACTFDCEVYNCSDRELDLSLRLENDVKSGFVWNCPLNYQIGKISAKEKRAISLSIVPFQLGIITITGITITELLLKRSHEFSNLISVFVLDKSDNKIIQL